MSKTCVVVGAAEIRSFEKIKKNLPENSFYIFCDGGLSYVKELKVNPDLIVGDFDSIENYGENNTSGAAEYIKEKYPDTEIIKLPRAKDDTDSFFAVKEALKRGFTDFILIGAIGQRFDHSLCNISILLYLTENGAKGKILDDYSEMEIVPENKLIKVTDNYSYFSLMAIDGAVEGISIKNAKFSLENGSLKTSFQYCSSNEVLPGKEAEIIVKKGVLLLIKVW